MNEDDDTCSQVDKRTIVDRVSCQAAFKAFSHGLLSEFEASLWENVLVAGGAVLASLLPLEVNWQLLINNDYSSPWSPLFYFVNRYRNPRDPVSLLSAKQQTVEKFMQTVCICTHTHTHTTTHTHVCVYVHIYFTYVYIHTYIRIYIHACIQTYVYTYTCMHR